MDDDELKVLEGRFIQNWDISNAAHTVFTTSINLGNFDLFVPILQNLKKEYKAEQSAELPDPKPRPTSSFASPLSFALHSFVTNELEKHGSFKELRKAKNISSKKLLQVLDDMDYDYADFLQKEYEQLGCKLKTAKYHGFSMNIMNKILIR